MVLIETDLFIVPFRKIATPEGKQIPVIVPFRKTRTPEGKQTPIIVPFRETAAPDIRMIKYVVSSKKLLILLEISSIIFGQLID